MLLFCSCWFFYLPLMSDISTVVVSGKISFSYVGISEMQWPGVCQSGARQSPIDITSNRTIVSEDIPALRFVGYDNRRTIYMENYAVSVRAINFDSWCAQRPYITGGGLIGKYYLENIHFHWSQIDQDGSEHSLDGLNFVSEVHMLHVKDGHDLDDEVWPDDMFAAVAIFVAIGKDDTNFRNLTPIFEKLCDINSTAIVKNFCPQELLPRDTSTFYRYSGSLTTPSCDEKVTWFVMRNPISITNEQLSILRHIRLESGILGQNIRKLQPANGRTVYFRPRTAGIRSDLAASLFSVLLAAIAALSYHSSLL